MKKLIFRQGVMSCGKSTLLLQVAYNYEQKGMKVKIIKPFIDKKGNDTIVSGIKVLEPRKVDYLVNDLDDFKNYLLKVANEGVSCVLVDESQFLSYDHISELYYFTKKYDIPVICYGLRADFRGRLFPGSASLFALADVIEELVTICSCGKKARFNARIINGEYTLDGNQVAIDGIDATYESMCGPCFLKKVLKRDL